MAMASGWKRPLQLAGVCWLAFAALLVLAYWVPFGDWADGWAVQGFINLERPRIDRAAEFVAELADPAPLGICTALLASVALYLRRRRDALALILLLGGA